MLKKSIFKSAIAFGMVAVLALSSSSFALTAASADIEYAPGQPITLINPSGGLARSSATRIDGTVSVSRPLVGGVMSATAESTTDGNVHRIGARARINDGVQMAYGTWNRLNNTRLATSTVRGNGRSGIAHGDHDVIWSSGGAVTTGTSSNWTFQ